MTTGTQAAKEAGNMVDLDSSPTKLIDIVRIGKQLLMTRGALTTFSVANDVAEYFAIIPVLFFGIYPQLESLNIMRLTSTRSAILTIICGVIYPGIVTGIAQAFFPDQANGSIITVTLKDGTQKDYGSALIAEKFTRPEYLIGRPMGMSNLSSTSEEQEVLVQQRIAWWRSFRRYTRQ